MTNPIFNMEYPVKIANLLDQVVRVLRESHDLNVSCYAESFLAQTLEKRLQAAVETSGGYLKRLAEDGAEAEAFSASLRVTYSEFFRNPLSFDLLEQLILPKLLSEAEQSGRREIRVWSAGCAAGQEAWSIAILLDEIIGARDKRLDYRIFATDLSESNLALANAGIYSAETLANVRLRHLRGYFSQQNDSFAMAPRLRVHVDFSLYDLLDERVSSPPPSIYGDFDIVMCCNVMLYYRPEKQRFILDRLWHCLAPGGYLMTDGTERQIVASAGGFRSVAVTAEVFQKKTFNHG
jgi:chemotaxis methyl-accepting protein methylase